MRQWEIETMKQLTSAVNIIMVEFTKAIGCAIVKTGVNTAAVQTILCEGNAKVRNGSSPTELGKDGEFSSLASVADCLFKQHTIPKHLNYNFLSLHRVCKNSTANQPTQ